VAEPGRSVADAPLEFRQLRGDLAGALRAFFRSFAEGPDHAFFHPHPMTDDEADRICAHGGRDLYYAACAAGRVLAYGLLRGWDEGYAIPSVGLAIAPEARGRGLARAFMAFLHAAAKQRGATQVRLTVDRDNLRAVELYRRLGYQLEPKNDDQLVGRLPL
jgi:ribosomal protein S18 acetylase RimI-like enzyme